MATIESTAAQLLDKLSELVSGPVRGLVEAHTAVDAPSWIPQGARAVLPDRRQVRVVRATKVVPGFGARVGVRLVHLGPAVPATANFVPCASGVEVTWLDPPGWLRPTARLLELGHGPRARGLRVGSCVEASELKTPADLFACGAQGETALVLLAPETRAVEEVIAGRFQRVRLEWRLRINLSTLSPEAVRRAGLRELHRNLVAVLQGATAGDDVVRCGNLRQVRQAGSSESWELSLSTELDLDGRALQPEAVEALGRFEELELELEGGGPEW